MTILESVWSLEHFLFGISYALLASLIFLFIVLILFKPKVKVCTFLCKYDNHSVPPFYVFKFVNMSYFPAHDVNVELHKAKRIPMGGGKANNEYKQLTLNNGKIFHIQGRPFFRTDTNPHCITVRSTDDINTILSDENNAITLRISLKHGLTGLSKVFEQEYANEQEIKPGKFKPGTRFELI